MGLEDRKFVIDVCAWFLNVTTSVLIVFVNKKLMDSRHGYKFVFGGLPHIALLDAHPISPSSLPAATTLCAFHFLSCAVSIWIVQFLGFAQPARLPWKGNLLCRTQLVSGRAQVFLRTPQIPSSLRLWRTSPSQA
jgi:hypothetical protein